MLGDIVMLFVCLSVVFYFLQHERENKSKGRFAFLWNAFDVLIIILSILLGMSSLVNLFKAAFGYG